MNYTNIAALITAVVCFGIDAACSIMATNNPNLQLVHQNSYLIIGACLAIFNPKEKANGGSQSS